MVDGAIEELAYLSAITSIKMSFWCFVNFILRSSMDIQDKSSLLTGFLCFTMHSLLHGHVYSLLYLIE
jgi:hypothetical protein